MKLRSVAGFLLALLCASLLAALPAAAQQPVYDNGPIDGQTDAWTINHGLYVDNTFYVSGANEQVTGMSFGVWLTPGDVLQSVEVTITSEPDYGTFYFDGVVTPTTSGCFLNSYSYDVCRETVDFGGGPFLASGTYWVTLKNAVVTGNDPVYWDENRGVGCDSPGCPSGAKENGNEGTLPSESFTMLGASGTTTGSSPEPSSLLLFGSGVVGVIGILRRKIF